MSKFKLRALRGWTRIGSRTLLRSPETGEIVTQSCWDKSGMHSRVEKGGSDGGGGRVSKWSKSIEKGGNSKKSERRRRALCQETT